MTHQQQPPKVIAIGTATPATKYSQSQVLERYRITDSKIKSIFENSHIQSRHLCLPPADEHGELITENQQQLLQKHQTVALHIGQLAIQRALAKANLTVQEIDYLAVVSTTGFQCPGLSAQFIQALGMRPDVQRIDIVGMGCNAGLNGMQPVVNHCLVNPDAVGLLLCVEVCSAMYVVDGTINTAVVNSLFGDGAAAAVISARALAVTQCGPKVLAFGSHVIPDALDVMRLDFVDDKFAFYLDKQTPYLLGQQIHIPVEKLLQRFDLKVRDIDHWLIHSGGKKVIDSIKYALNISDHDVRHTLNVLRDFGNLSSGSFLFSQQQLLQENVANSGDLVFMMTMGPGATIECCLGVF